MKLALYSLGGETYLEATSENLDMALAKLDSKIYTGLTLYAMPDGLLQVFGGKEERVFLSFTDGTTLASSRGKLVDPDYVSVKKKIKISFGGELTWIPFYLTVTKEMAKQVVLYFINHQTLPKGLTWEGNMSKYE